MPNKDGTGPCRKGPRTGKQQGKCQGAIEINNNQRGCCRRGRGQGTGRSCRRE